MARRRSPMRERLDELRAMPWQVKGEDYFVGRRADEAEILADMPGQDEYERRQRLEMQSPRNYLFDTLFCAPLLTREQEFHLFRQMNYHKWQFAQVRTQKATAKAVAECEYRLKLVQGLRNRIACANLRLVWNIVRKKNLDPDTSSELVSEGNLAVLRAIDFFDFTLGNKFSTYASWALFRHIPDVLERMRKHHVRRVDAQQPVLNEHPARPDRECYAEEAGAVIRSMSPFHGRVMELIYGLRDGQPKTLQQVGQLLGVSKERVRQYRLKAISEARRSAKLVV